VVSRNLIDVHIESAKKGLGNVHHISHYGKTYIDIHKYHSDLLTHVNCGAIWTLPQSPIVADDWTVEKQNE